MKYKSIILLLIMAGVASSCLSKTTPECTLSVSTEKDSYSVGETVSFNFNGHADNIVFYSGETGHIYEKKDATLDENNLTLQIRMFTDGTYSPNFQFLVSSDFSGEFTKESVQAATWTDLAPRLGIPTEPGTLDSNTLSLKDELPEVFAQENPRLYFAVRYWDLDPENPVGNRWCLKMLSLKKVTPDGVESTIADVKTGGWTAVNCGSYSGLWSITWTQLLALGTTTAIRLTPGKDEYAITKAFYPKQCDPDEGEVVTRLGLDVSKFEYSYSEPGTYEAVFDCSSVWYNGDERKIVRKSVTIK